MYAFVHGKARSVVYVVYADVHAERAAHGWYLSAVYSPLLNMEMQ